MGEFSDAVAGIVLEGSSSDGCVVGDKDALSAAKCLCVFEVDVDSTNCRADARSVSVLVVLRTAEKASMGCPWLLLRGPRSC